VTTCGGSSSAQKDRANVIAITIHATFLTFRTFSNSSMPDPSTQRMTYERFKHHSLRKQNFLMSFRPAELADDTDHLDDFKLSLWFEHSAAALKQAAVFGDHLSGSRHFRRNLILEEDGGVRPR
jgi:hypothetical protein